MNQKCIVYNCKNKRNEGNFIGDFCFPCWEFIIKGVGKYSQIYRNALKYITKK
jgi:hypothetical protein